MILSFGDNTTDDIFNGLDSRAARSIPRSAWGAACRKLDMINAATELGDLRIPPANRLEKLRGKLDGYYSIRVNDQYRIIFIWNNHNAEKVMVTDYH